MFDIAVRSVTILPQYQGNIALILYSIAKQYWSNTIFVIASRLVIIFGEKFDSFLHEENVNYCSNTDFEVFKEYQGISLSSNFMDLL